MRPVRPRLRPIFLARSHRSLTSNPLRTQSCPTHRQLASRPRTRGSLYSDFYTAAPVSSILEVPHEIIWHNLDCMLQHSSRPIYTVILDRFSCVPTAAQPKLQVLLTEFSTNDGLDWPASSTVCALCWHLSLLWCYFNPSLLVSTSPLPEPSYCTRPCRHSHPIETHVRDETIPSAQDETLRRQFARWPRQCLQGGAILADGNTSSTHTICHRLQALGQLEVSTENHATSAAEPS